MTVVAGHPDPEAFAPFGAFLHPPATVGERSMFGAWLEPVGGLAQQCHFNRVAPGDPPVELTRLERHPRAAQLFLPIEVSRYLVTVMPHDPGGDPDVGRALAFVVPGGVGVAYRPNTWHASITALDQEATFAVLMWRGSGQDDVFADIAPLRVEVGDSSEAPPDG